MTAWALGVRLALTANRVRLVVTAVAIAFTAAFLLGVLGALPARQAKLDRLDARNAVQAPSTAPTSADAVQLETRDGWYRGRPLTVRFVRATSSALLPPGLQRYPRAGEVVASPDLAAVLRGPRAGELARRIPGRVNGTIAEPGLAGPHELYAYVGIAAFDHDVPPVEQFGYHRDRAPVPEEIRIAAWLGAVGLLLPVLVLVATATRLSAASRDRRLAALRLVGATPRQARVLAGAEGLVAGILGAAGGLVVFALLRPVGCALLPFPEGVFARDLRPPLLSAALVLVGVPLLAAVSGVVALRRVVTTPLGVRRDARVRTASWWRLVPLLVGLLLLVVMRVRYGQTGHLEPGLLLVGGGLTLVGLAVAAPTVTRLGGRLLERLPGVSPHLAARRVDADPTAAARVVTGMVLVLFVAAWLLAFLPVLDASRGDTQLLQLVPHGTVQVGTDPSGQPDEAALRATRGVRGVAVLRGTTLTPPGWTGDDGLDGEHSSQYVDIGSCPDLAVVLHRALPCGSTTAFQYSGSAPPWLRPGATVGVLGDDGTVSGHVRLPARIADVPLPPYNALLQGTLLLDPSVLATARPRAVLLATDGTADTVERVRAQLPGAVAMGTLSIDDSVRTSAAVYLGYLRAVRIGILLALLIGAASLAVTTADTVLERRRGLATLVALGAPTRVLRRSVLLQTAVPMLANVAVALGAACVASACYLGVTDEAWTLPWGSWALTALAAVGAVLLATLTTLPLVRAVGRPEALRAE